MSNPTTISGMLDAKGLKIAILATRFNDFIVDRLTGGALDYLERHGLDAKNITIVRIPGAFEIPWSARSWPPAASMTASWPWAP